MKKKFLALVLALVMTLTLLPVTAMAADTYTVTFDPAGATGPLPTQAATAEGGTFTLPSAGSGLASELKKNGYAFQGWYDGSNTYKKGATYTMPAHDVTFIAQWVSIKIDSYILLVSAVDNTAYLEIDYTINNLTATDMDCDVWYRIATDNVPVELNKDSNISIPANSTYSGTLIDRFAYSDEIARAEQMRLHLKGTGSVADSADIAYCSMGSSDTVLSNLRKGCYVTLDANGGLYNGEATATVFVDENGDYGSFEWVDASPSREGYTFLGYARTDDATTPEHANDTLKDVAWAGSAVAKWYAVWERNTYDITVEKNAGGTVTVQDKALYADTVSVTITPNPGCEVNKVQLKYNSTEIVDLTNATSFTMPAANVTLVVEFIGLRTPLDPVQNNTYYFVEHYVEQPDGSYKPVETEVLNGEIGATVTADSTKYDDNTHHVNTTKSTLDGVVSFDLTAENPMETVLTLKVYYDRNSKSPTYTPTPETEKVEPAKTADAGILLAVGMSILSVTGSAVLLKKKED